MSSSHKVSSVTDKILHHPPCSCFIFFTLKNIYSQLLSLLADHVLTVFSTSLVYSPFKLTPVWQFVRTTDHFNSHYNRCIWTFPVVQQWHLSGAYELCFSFIVVPAPCCTIEADMLPISMIGIKRASPIMWARHPYAVESNCDRMYWKHFAEEDEL